MSQDELGDLKEVKSQWIKWGKPGDWVRGTLCDVREMKSNLSGKENEMVKVYEFIVAAGSFHYFEKVNGAIQIEETPTVLKKGDVWTIGGKAGIDAQMRNVKIGQVFGMRFTEEKPNENKAFNSTKIVKVLIGEMDPEYQGQTGADTAGVKF